MVGHKVEARKQQEVLVHRLEIELSVEHERGIRLVRC